MQGLSGGPIGSGWPAGGRGGARTATGQLMGQLYGESESRNRQPAGSRTASDARSRATSRVSPGTMSRRALCCVPGTWLRFRVPRLRIQLPAGHHPGFRAPRYRHGRGLDVGRWRRRASSRRFVAFSFAGRLAGPAGRRDGHLDAHQAPARGFREAAEAHRRPHQVPAENRTSALQHLRGAQGACATYEVRRLVLSCSRNKNKRSGENPL